MTTEDWRHSGAEMRKGVLEMLMSKSTTSGDAGTSSLEHTQEQWWTQKPLQTGSLYALNTVEGRRDSSSLSQRCTVRVK